MCEHQSVLDLVESVVASRSAICQRRDSVVLHSTLVSLLSYDTYIQTTALERHDLHDDPRPSN